MDALKQIPKEERWVARPRLIQAAGSAWLRARAESSGFALREVQTAGYDQVEIPRDATARNAKQLPIRFSVLDLEGELEVADPAIFLAAIAAGFGRARAFGCGLMLIRRGRT
jgi:CRISPR system Cascade subunit CasE